MLGHIYYLMFSLYYSMCSSEVHSGVQQACLGLRKENVCHHQLNLQVEFKHHCVISYHLIFQHPASNVSLHRILYMCTHPLCKEGARTLKGSYRKAAHGAGSHWKLLRPGAFLTSHFFLQNKHFILNCREVSLRISFEFHSLETPLEQMPKNFPLKWKVKSDRVFYWTTEKDSFPYTHTSHVLTWCSDNTR